MFDIGFGEMLLLAAIALIAIGPKQLPEVARVVGRMMNEFKRATGDFTRTIMEARDSTHEMLSETQRSILDTVNQNAQPNDPHHQPGHPTEPQPEVPPENQMSFNLTDAPANEPAAQGAQAHASAPAAEPALEQVKRES